MRTILIKSQIREGCASGSWDPIAPVKVPFAEQAGRLFITSLAALTLEVYYRYLPLYKLDTETEPPQSILGKLAADKEKAALAKQQQKPPTGGGILDKLKGKTDKPAAKPGDKPKLGDKPKTGDKPKLGDKPKTDDKPKPGDKKTDKNNAAKGNP
jgi:hypothetical protein